MPELTQEELDGIAEILAGEDDTLDGCDIDFTPYLDDELTASLRGLFPDGDPALAGEWQELADAGLLEQP